MTEEKERFVRWQGHTMAQMSVVLALLGTLSLGGLALCFSLLQQSSFKPSGLYAAAFLVCLLALLIASVASISATVTRLLDFRLTTQRLRHGVQVEPLTYFGANANAFGKATWRLFWCAAGSLILAVVLLALVVAKIYLGRVLDAVGF